jgi:hypothetical protein
MAASSSPFGSPWPWRSWHGQGQTNWLFSQLFRWKWIKLSAGPEPETVTVMTLVQLIDDTPWHLLAVAFCNQSNPTLTSGLVATSCNNYRSMIRTCNNPCKCLGVCGWVFIKQLKVDFIRDGKLSS